VEHRSAKRLAALVAFLGIASLMAQAAQSAPAATDRPAGIPVVAVVSLKEQKITVYDSDGPILKASVSTGQEEYETPAGIFSILQKERDHASNLYDAEMPFMQRLTWSGIALHAGALPGYRASHGCIRLPYGFAENLFETTSVGTRVVVAPRGATAKPISHPVLSALEEAGRDAAPAGTSDAAREMAGKLREEAAAAAQRAAAAAADARQADAAKAAAVKRLGAAVARSGSATDSPAKVTLEAEVERLRGETAAKIAAAIAAQTAANAAAGERQAAEERANLARLRAWPTSILVSLATRRIYVRQGFEPVLDLPVEVREPDQSIGTHALYATERSGGDRGWMAVTLEGGDVRGALDRVSIPDAAAKLIERGMWPGSTLIVTDEPPFKETGTGTDFMVVLSDEPQGALKLRSPADRSPAERPVAQRAPSDNVRAYRAAADDQHFRHPLGGGFP